MSTTKLTPSVEAYLINLRRPKTSSDRQKAVMEHKALYGYLLPVYGALRASCAGKFVLIGLKTGKSAEFGH